MAVESDPEAFAVLCDLDGVVWLSQHAIAGSPEAIARLRTAGHRVEPSAEVKIAGDPSIEIAIVTEVMQPLADLVRVPELRVDDHVIADGDRTTE